MKIAFIIRAVCATLVMIALQDAVKPHTLQSFELGLGLAGIIAKWD